MSGFELDVTKNIKTIELLKSSMLSSISELFTTMACDTKETRDYADVLADIVILSYMLSEKLGINNDTLELKIINKIKLSLLEETEWRNELKLLQKHFM